MAKKQTRRSVSLNRSDYEAAKLEAARRGMTLTALVESGLAAVGVAIVAHPQQSPALAQLSASRRAASVAERALLPQKRGSNRDRDRMSARVRASNMSRESTFPQKRAAEISPSSRRSSRERQVLGDQIADACGFQ